MKLNGSVLVAVAMMIGSAGALGCNANPLSAEPEAAAPAPVELSAPVQPAKAAAKDESATVVAKASLGVKTQQPVMYAPLTQTPPPERFEHYGPAPSRDHQWIKGHWRRGSTRYVWVNGRWSNELSRTAPPPARFENPGRAPSVKHFYVPGHWKLVNGRHVWIGGRWDTKVAGRKWIQARHDRANGQWRYVPGHWVKG